MLMETVGELSPAPSGNVLRGYVLPSLVHNYKMSWIKIVLSPQIALVMHRNLVAFVLKRVEEQQPGA